MNSTDSPKRLARLHLVVWGDVQGVGFRYAVQRLATRLGLTGWVRNLDSGEVELVAEGPQPALLQLVEACRRGAGTVGHVRGEQVEWQTPRGEFSRFEIRPNGPRRS